MIIFVGDKPSSRMKPGAKPFEGAACEKRLNAWIKKLGIIKYEMINSTDFGFDFQIGLADGFGCLIIALGNNAYKAIDKARKGPTMFSIYDRKPIFKLPHPSGRNRQINDKEFIAQKLKECKDWLGVK